VLITQQDFGTETEKWLSWWATVAGALGVVAGVVGIAKPDAYMPIPFLLLLVWMIAVAIATVMRPDDTAPVIPSKRAHHQIAATD